MTHIIQISTPKGGAGKTTIALNLASCYAHRQGIKRVGLLDIDPQQSAYEFLIANPQASITALNKSSPEDTKDFDIIIADTSPVRDQDSYSFDYPNVIKVYIMQPSYLDADSLFRLSNVAANPPSIIVLNRFDNRSRAHQKIFDDIKKEFETLGKTEIVKIPELKVFQMSLMNGYTIYDPRAKAISGSNEAIMRVTFLADILSFL